MSFVNVISSIAVNHLQNVQTLTSYLQYHTMDYYIQIK